MIEENLVIHPAHYQGQRFEVIDIIEDFALNFNLGNAIKYLLRAGKKGKRDMDYRKLYGTSSGKYANKYIIPWRTHDGISLYGITGDDRSYLDL